MLVPPPSARKARKRLSADALHQLIRTGCERIADPRGNRSVVPLPDAIMSAFAMFSLKDESLLAFDGRRSEKNMKNLFRIGQVPSDTQMREILDGVPSDELRPLFNDVFRELQRGKVLTSFAFYKDAYLLSLDGTGYFSSQKIHCECCQEKVNKKTGGVTYYHQMLGAVLVHPDRKEVIPLAPEPIQKQDGSSKNDCERNAAKRLLEKIRREHRHLKLIVIEDGLASNAPHIRLLKNLRMNFILGAKPGDHESLFDQVIAGYEQDKVTTIEWQEGDTHCEIGFLNDVPLNDSNPDLLVNYFCYTEHGADGKLQKCFTWVTDLKITNSNAHLLVRGGRARWKIENETFNTLKNQGYHYEHNYGHGKKNLSVVFAMLMMLAFLVDQVQQHCCPLFKAVLEKLGTKRKLWDRKRSHFWHFTFRSTHHLYEVMLYDLAKEVPAPTLGDTS